MRTFSTLGAIALVSLGVASQASAFSLGPKSTSFTGTGATTLTKGSVTVPCTATFKGSINASGVGSITSATFTGDLGLCGLITSANLPWTGTATSASAGTIYTPQVDASLFGTCGPTAVPVSVSTSGVIGFNNTTLAPNCAISGSIQTTPHVTISNP